MNRRRTVIPVLLAAAIAGGGAIPALAGAPTPEEAIARYLGAVAASDLDAILDASAVDEMAAGYDFTLEIGELGALIPYGSMVPAESAFGVALDRGLLAGRLLSQVKALTWSLPADRPIDVAGPQPMDAADAALLADALDPARPAGLSVIDIEVLDPALLERAAAFLTRNAARFGADERTERIVLLDLEGATYLLGFTVLRYGDAWAVEKQNASLADTSRYGDATPITRDEWDALVTREE